MLEARIFVISCGITVLLFYPAQDMRNIIYGEVLSTEYLIPESI